GADPSFGAKSHPISPVRPSRQSLYSSGAESGGAPPAASSPAASSPAASSRGASTSEQLSPFERDRARRGESEMSSGSATAIRVEAAVGLATAPIAAFASATAAI